MGCLPFRIWKDTKIQKESGGGYTYFEPKADQTLDSSVCFLSTSSYKSSKIHQTVCKSNPSWTKLQTGPRCRFIVMPENRKDFRSERKNYLVSLQVASSFITKGFTWLWSPNLAKNKNNKEERLISMCTQLFRCMHVTKIDMLYPREPQHVPHRNAAFKMHRLQSQDRLV